MATRVRGWGFARAMSLPGQGRRLGNVTAQELGLARPDDQHAAR